MIWPVIGACAACLTMFSFIPQITKVMRTKSARDVSVVMLLQLTAGVTLWIVYGIYRRDPIIIVANSVTLASMIVLLWLYYRYAKHARHCERPQGAKQS